MRINVLLLLMVCLCIYFSSSNGLNAAERDLTSQDTSEAKKTVTAFLEALISGDVDGLKNYASSNYHDKNRALLNENTEYSNFLVRFYQGAKTQLKKINQVNGNVIARVQILFRDQSNENYVIYLKDEEGIWKVNEINELSRDQFERIRKSKDREKSELPINK